MDSLLTNHVASHLPLAQINTISPPSYTSQEHVCYPLDISFILVASFQMCITSAQEKQNRGFFKNL